MIGGVPLLIVWLLGYVWLYQRREGGGWSLVIMGALWTGAAFWGLVKIGQAG